MQSSDVMLGSEVNAERGVPLHVGVLARRRLSQASSALFPWVCAHYFLFVYNAGRGLVPLPLVGLLYRVRHCLIYHVAPFGA